MLVGELAELIAIRPAALLIKDLAQHAGGVKPGESRKVNARFRMPSSA